MAFLALFFLPLSSYGYTTHFVVVGNKNQTYDPSNITAAPGDVIAFSYRAKNHTGANVGSRPLEYTIDLKQSHNPRSRRLASLSPLHQANLVFSQACEDVCYILFIF